MKLFTVNTKNTLAVIAIAFMVFSFFLHTVAFAETGNAYFSVSPKNIAPQSEFSVKVYIDTANLINALDLQVVYPPSMLLFLGENNENSIVGIWQGGNPLLRDGHVRLTGALLTPFSGKGGFIATLKFKALAPGDAKISFERNVTYLADGQGTKITLGSSSTTIGIHTDAPRVEAPVEQIQDTTPPLLVLRLVKDSATAKYIIVYNASDADSGIQTVEMRKKQWLSWSDWQSMSNPAVYPEGADSVEVRAINNAGVKTIASLVKPRHSYARYILFLVIGAVFAGLLLYNKRRQRPKIL